MEYHYFMYGMFDGTDGNRYDICIHSPFVRNSKVEAMKDENYNPEPCLLKAGEAPFSYERRNYEHCIL